MAVINITKENFAQEVLHSEKPVLLDFWASWCGPCRMLSPVVDEVAEERTDVKVGKVNVDEQPDRRGAQRHRRSGRSCLRRSEREAAHPCAPRRRAGRVRLLRPCMGSAEEVRSGRCHHLQDRPRDAGQVKTVYPYTAVPFARRYFLRLRDPVTEKRAAYGVY